MSYIDLTPALRDWPHDPEKISVRKILGIDGQVRIQMRVELGIAQMEAEGRPDGARPHGCVSLLDHHRARLAHFQHGNGTSLGFALNAEECQELRIEASMYYRRYVAYYVLEEFQPVIRDTAHNLAIIDFCREHAMEIEDRAALEEFRPYVLMMHSRGLAYQALADGEAASALAHVNRGVLMIRAYLDDRGLLDVAESCEEIKILRSLGRELNGKVPQNSVLITHKALQAAIDQERFEEAARLRDAMRKLTQPASEVHRPG